MNRLLHRPIAVLSIATAVLLAGFWVASRLPLEWTPKVELPAVRVSASWPGASPSSVERFIAAPIERAVQTVQGTMSVESLSEEGRATISLEVDEDVDLAVYIAEINDRLTRLHDVLPDRVKPYLTKQIPEALRDEQGFMTLQLIGPLTPEALRKLAEQEVAPRLQSLQGLADVEVSGGAAQELRITLNAERMAAVGIEPGLLQQRLSSVLSDEVYGRLREAGRATLLLHPAENRLSSLRRLVVNEPALNTPPVRLQDVARVQMASAPVYTISRVDGQPVVTLMLSRASGSHMIETSHRVQKRIEEIRASLPGDVRLLVADDRTEAVRGQLDDLAWRGGLGLLLVLLVLLFMLKSIRATVVVIYSVMVSLSVAFLLLAFFNMTLNLLTIAGLVLVFGLLVDNSVVIVEQIQLQVKRSAMNSDQPLDWLKVTQNARKAVWLPLFGGTLSTMAVLVPLVYLSGELRALFLPFGVLVSFTLGASLVTAIVLIPVLMRIIPFNLEAEYKQKGWRRKVGTWPYLVTGRFPRISLMAIVLCLGIPIWLLPKSIEQPEEKWSRPVSRLAGLYNDTVGSEAVQAGLKAVEPWVGGVLRPFTRTVNFGQAWNFEQRPEVGVRLGFPTGNPIERADSLMIQFEQLALASSSVSRIIIQITERRAYMRVQFHEDALRTSEPFRVRENLIQRAVLMGGVSVSVFGLIQNGYFSGSGGMSSGMTVEAFGPNYQDLEALSNRFADRLKRASRRVFEVNTNAGRFGYTEEREVLRIKWDAEATVRTGISAQALSSHLRPVLNTRFPFQFADLEGETRVPIRMLVSEADQLEIATLVESPLAVRDSLTVKLAGTSAYSIERMPAAIERKDQQYKRRIQVDFRGPSKMASEFLDAQLAAIPIPAGYRIEKRSYAFFDEDVATSYFWVILGTLLLVFLVTAGVFESWRLPWVVLLSVPLALIGVAAGFLWSDANFAEGAFIGSVLLIGIAVNDSILLVDRYRQLRELRPGASSGLMIRLAVKERLRPMWTTTLSSIMAMLPLLVFPDDGDFWMGLAVTVVGGLLASTLLSPIATVALLSLKRQT